MIEPSRTPLHRLALVLSDVMSCALFNVMLSAALFTTCSRKSLNKVGSCVPMGSMRKSCKVRLATITWARTRFWRTVRERFPEGIVVFPMVAFPDAGVDPLPLIEKFASWDAKFAIP